MHLRSRRLAGASAALALALAMTSCADEDELGNGPSASETPTVEPAGDLEAFCAAVPAIDTAILQAPQSPGAGETDGSDTADSENTETSDPDGSETSDPDGSDTSDTSDTETSDTDGSETSDTDSGTSTAQEAFANRFETLLEDAADAAPEEIAGDFDDVVAAYEDGLDAGDAFGALETPEFTEADARVDEFMLDECDFGQLSVTGVEYEFEGLPEQVEAGPTAVTLDNQGEEDHEIALLRFDDDVDIDVEELLDLSADEAMKAADPAGVVFAPAGASQTSFFDLSEGRYAAVCFLPIGEDGPPHYTEGMFGQFEVVGEGEATESPATESPATEPPATESPDAGDTDAESPDAQDTDTESPDVEDTDTESPEPEDTDSPDPADTDSGDSTARSEDENS